MEFLNLKVLNLIKWQNMGLQLSWGFLQTRGDEWKAREAQRRKNGVGGSLHPGLVRWTLLLAGGWVHTSFWVEAGCRGIPSEHTPIAQGLALTSSACPLSNYSLEELWGQ